MVPELVQQHDAAVQVTHTSISRAEEERYARLHLRRVIEVVYSSSFYDELMALLDQFKTCFV
jgi:hypothetical protein